MSGTVDTAITVVLFIAALPAVAAAVFVGLHLTMLGDGVTTTRGLRAVLVGVVGVPASAIAVYVTAVILAWRSSGYTFYYPIVALAVGALLTVGLSGLGERLVRRSRTG